MASWRNFCQSLTRLEKGVDRLDDLLTDGQEKFHRDMEDIKNLMRTLSGRMEAYIKENQDRLQRHAQSERLNLRENHFQYPSSGQQKEMTHRPKEPVQKFQQATFKWSTNNSERWTMANKFEIQSKKTLVSLPTEGNDKFSSYVKDLQDTTPHAAKIATAVPFSFKENKVNAENEIRKIATEIKVSDAQTQTPDWFEENKITTVQNEARQQMLRVTSHMELHVNQKQPLLGTRAATTHTPSRDQTFFLEPQNANMKMYEGPRRQKGFPKSYSSKITDAEGVWSWLKWQKAWVTVVDYTVLPNINKKSVERVAKIKKRKIKIVLVYHGTRPPEL